MAPGRHALASAIALLAALLLLAPPAGVLAEGVPNAAATDVASYDMRVSLDVDAKQMRGAERITYRNVSADTLDEVWLHLYLNAFRSPDTQWMQEASGQHRGFSADAPGWIRLDRLAVAGTGEDLPLPDGGDTDLTTVRVPLPRRVAPGESVQLDVDWTSQLPRVFARTGYVGDYFMVGQWYPKLAVYDRGRWDNEPWHANAEFFADFGSYDLTVTVPEGFLTGGSGVRLDTSANGDGTQTVRYRAERVTDVAWTAWPGYLAVARDVVAAGQPVEIELLLPRGQAADAERHLAAAEAALDAFGNWYGAYPWPKLTVVVPPPDAGGAGGMEYPTLVTTGSAASLPSEVAGGVHLVEIVTAHEIAHEWFPMQVQSNEAAEAWLDEGFAEYLTIRVLNRLYGAEHSAAATPFGGASYEQVQRTTFVASGAREPLAKASWDYPSFGTYAAVAYGKGSLTLLTLERTLGEERFTRALRAYADRWRWRHPTSGDLEQSIEDSTQESLEWFFNGLVFGDRVVEFRVEGIQGSHAFVERTGDMAFPVDVRVTTADGQSRTQRWDGVDWWLDVDGGGQPIVEVIVDPDNRVPLELDRLDNSATQRVNLVGPAAVAIRWLAAVQQLLQVVGTFG